MTIRRSGPACGSTGTPRRPLGSTSRSSRTPAITGITPGPTGAVLVVAFRLAGAEFLALNGGPQFRFNEAVSLSVDCRSQEELDELWEKLSAGGSPGRCGWLKDRYGLSWQIVPSVLPTSSRARTAAGRGASWTP